MILGNHTYADNHKSTSNFVFFYPDDKLYTKIVFPLDIRLNAAGALPCV